MNIDRLNALLARFPAQTVLVVGDFFLDKYLIIEHALGEISLETGLEAHQVVEVRCQPGAAGTVTSNLRAMDVNVIALGVIGDDGEGFELTRALRATGVDTSQMVVAGRDRFTATYTKPMLREPDGTAHELNRLDIKNRAPLPAATEEALIHRLRDLLPRVRGVIVADQAPEADCGSVTARVREELAILARAHPQVIVAADSRVRIGLFRDMIVKPNAREAVRAVSPERWPGAGDPTLARDRELIEAAGAALHAQTGRPTFLTVGGQGILVFEAGGMTHAPAPPVTGPIDIVGAGDSAMASIVAALCAGATPAEAAQVGNLAAAVTIRQIGATGTASREQITDCARTSGL